MLAAARPGASETRKVIGHVQAINAAEAKRNGALSLDQGTGSAG